MIELFKTLLFLNVQGSVLVILLLALKRLVHKSFSGRAQRNLWLFSAVVFLLPLWKLVPSGAAEPIILPNYTYEYFTYEAPEYTERIEENEAETLEPNADVFTVKHDIKPWIWGMGAGVFLILNCGSYAVFLAKKRKNSKCAEKDELFDAVLQDLNIKRKVRLKKCKDEDAPMLTGIFFPVVYVPEREIEDETARYIYLHELTHYKHKDLPLKWFVCIINAINWFNPFMYLVMNNINAACEIYCDEAVTENMDSEGKKAYMNTILNLVAKKGENNV